MTIDSRPEWTCDRCHKRERSTIGAPQHWVSLFCRASEEKQLDLCASCWYTIDALIRRPGITQEKLRQADQS